MFCSWNPKNTNMLSLNHYSFVNLIESLMKVDMKFSSRVLFFVLLAFVQGVFALTADQVLAKSKD